MVSFIFDYMDNYGEAEPFFSFFRSCLSCKIVEWEPLSIFIYP